MKPCKVAKVSYVYILSVCTPRDRRVHGSSCNVGNVLCPIEQDKLSPLQSTFSAQKSVRHDCDTETEVVFCDVKVCDAYFYYQ